MAQRIDYYTLLSDYTAHLMGIESQLAKTQLGVSLLTLVKVRASQINGCAFCLHMHTAEALRRGEAVERLGLVAGFRESPLFSDAEKAALTWTEEVTRIERGTPGDAAYVELRAHFDEQQIAELTLAISMINLWNRMAVSMKSLHPDRPLTRIAKPQAA